MKQFSSSVIDILASGFRTGYAPIASGTFGTLPAIPFVVLLRLYSTEWVYLLVTVILVLTSFYIAHKAEALYQESDSGKIVIDEIAGYFVTCAFLPIFRWDLFVFAFFAFRFFDIAKLWPANFFNNRKGGFNVVMDDLVAGAYANMATQLYLFLITTWFVTSNVGRT